MTLTEWCKEEEIEITTEMIPLLTKVWHGAKSDVITDFMMKSGKFVPGNEGINCFLDMIENDDRV